jgi:hypothetical protein
LNKDVSGTRRIGSSSEKKRKFESISASSDGSDPEQDQYVRLSPVKIMLNISFNFLLLN